MIKRKMNGHEILPIGFGTSTFVKGKKCPNADSDNGIAVLNYVVDSGVTVIHSSKTLLTQWGIKKALGSRSDGNRILHLVKVKLNPIVTYNDIILSYVDNYNSLGFGDIMLQLEFEDGISGIVKNKIVHSIVECNNEKAYPLYLYLNSEEEAEQFIGTEGIIGFVSKFNKVSNWIHPFIHKIEEEDQEFIVVSPFSGGKNVDIGFLRDCFSISGITCVVVSSSNRFHWSEIFDIIK